MSEYAHTEPTHCEVPGRVITTLSGSITTVLPAMVTETVTLVPHGTCQRPVCESNAAFFTDPYTALDSHPGTRMYGSTEDRIPTAVPALAPDTELFRGISVLPTDSFCTGKELSTPSSIAVWL